MPGDLGEPVVTTLVCFFHLHARLRVHWAPGIPHALCFQGRKIHAHLGRIRAAGMQSYSQTYERTTLSVVFTRESG
jgi:hypothetical protein